MKNKNKPDENLKKIKGDIYFSESENQLYRVKDETQTPIAKDDVKGIWEELQKSYKETGSTLKNIFSKLGIKFDSDDDESALPFI